MTKIGGLSTVQTPRRFFRPRSRAGHVARPDSARFVAAFDVFTARRRQLPPFRTHAHEPHRRARHTHPAQSQSCASLTPAPRASRPSSAPRATSRPPRPRSPSSRRRNASTPPNKMRGACAPETPLRHASATPTNATRANPPAGTRERTTSDRRRRPRRERRHLEAARRAFPARASADGSGFSAPRTTDRDRDAPETAHARSDATARAPRARSTPSLGRSRGRDATAAPARVRGHLLRTTPRRDDTRTSLTRKVPSPPPPPPRLSAFLISNAFKTILSDTGLTDTPPTRFSRAWASRLRARAPAAAARFRFSATTPACASSSARVSSPRSSPPLCPRNDSSPPAKRRSAWKTPTTRTRRVKE